VVSSAATFNSATEYINWSGILVVLLFVLLQADQADAANVNLCSHTEISCMPRDENWPRLIDLGLVTFKQSTYWIATDQ